MSLIHDALKSMDTDAPQPSRPGPSARARAEAPRGRPAWLDGLLAFCVVVGAGVVGWQVWQGHLLPLQRPAVPGTAAVVAPPVPLAQAPVPASSGDAVAVKESAMDHVASTAPVPASVAPVSGAAPAVEPPAAAAATAQPQAAPAVPVASASPDTTAAVHRPPVARPHAASPSHPVRTARRRVPAAASPAPTAAPKVDDTPVQVRFTRFVAAMRAGQTADAERELTALKAVLPPDALGLLRAQAWFDLRGERPQAAARGYRQILERLPGDEEAAVNLASIQASQSDQEGARATLDAAARLNPDSKALRAALAQYTPNARK